MYSKNYLLFGLLAILLLGGTITPSMAQDAPEQNIVINEVEINPKGSDAGIGVGGSGIDSKTTIGLSGSQEYVELYNPTSNNIDISGWSIAPSATWKTYVIPPNTVIESNSFLAFTHVNFWFKDFGDQVTLYDSSSKIIDKTPLLIDKNDDVESWQRIMDGLDTDSETDWELKRMSPKSANNTVEEITPNEIFTLIGQADKTNYSFNETVILSGSVSELLYTEKPYFTQQLIKISINGPNYFKNLALFPERDLTFSTSLNLQKVLGFNTGDYDVKISYGENVVETNFNLASEATSSSTEVESEFLQIFADKESYIPGETAIIFADTNSSLEFGGLEYTVTNPNDVIIFEGTIFPNERFSTVYQSGAGQIYPFSTQLFMETVNPVYGTYEINGTFKSLNVRAYASDTITAKATFNLVADVKEDVPISISTEKELYSAGEIIKVTGRSNDVWVETLSVEVLQTGVITRDTSDIKGQHIRPDPFTLKESVRLNGDGTFEFEFKVVEGINTEDNYEKTYGDYKITISEHFGTASTFFKIVEDPESYSEVRTPLGLKTDKSEYVLGTSVTFSGRVLDYEHKIRDNIHNSVKISITDPDGNPITYEDHQQKSGYTNCYTNDCSQYSKTLTYTAIPDPVGGYSLDFILSPIKYDYGVYTATAVHELSGISESVQFTIKSAQDDIVQKAEEVEPITLQLCTSDRVHVNEIVKDLTQIGRGEIAPSMESVDCSNNNVFEIGDKLIVTGTVIPKTGVALDQSSTKTSGQTQQGSSYSTNYAQAAMNYVEVSIPYPKSMVVTNSAAWKTSPTDGSTYTGGGGSGEGGSYYKDKDGNVIRPDTNCEVSAAGDCSPTQRSDRLGEGSYDGTAVLQKQTLLLKNMNLKAYPDENGKFVGVFELRAGVFTQGTYSVKANYFGYNTEELVTITDNTLKGGLKPQISVELDKTEFLPGETVRINGKIKNIYYYDNVSVIIKTPYESNVNCFAGQQCGFGNSEKKLRVQDSDNGPVFFWNHKISPTAALGEYKILVDTHFGEFEKSFFVIDESEVITESSIMTKTKKIIEKFNRIPDNEIPITLGEKLSDDSTLAPRVLQGSLFTSARGEESDVNLRITTNTGQCIIGQDSDCLVTESTRKPGEIYSIVSIDDVNYKIRYSGNDVRLEKFSIVPEESNSQIDVDNWKVEVIKDEQPTRFYYKVSYIAIE